MGRFVRSQKREKQRGMEGRTEKGRLFSVDIAGKC
jgi:hypothetical protein